MDWQGLPIQELLNELPKGVAVAVTLLLIFLGYKKGSNAEPRKEIEIAGGIVDNTAIFKLASSIDRHNQLMEENQEHYRHMIEAFNRNTEEIRQLAREIREGVTSYLRNRR